MEKDNKDAYIADLESQIQKLTKKNAKLQEKIKEKNRKLNTARQKALRASKKKTSQTSSSDWDALQAMIDVLRIMNMEK